jgi:hypothetical protein
MTDFRKYGIEYNHQGQPWMLTVMATSAEDAMQRVKHAAAWGRCYTPHGIEMEIPAYPGAGLFVRTLVWLRNRFAPVSKS